MSLSLKKCRSSLCGDYYQLMSLSILFILLLWKWSASFYDTLSVLMVPSNVLGTKKQIKWASRRLTGYLITMIKTGQRPRMLDIWSPAPQPQLTKFISLLKFVNLVVLVDRWRWRRRARGVEGAPETTVWTSRTSQRGSSPSGSPRIRVPQGSARDTSRRLRCWPANMATATW